MRFLTLMFSEPGGGPSSARALTAFVVIVIVGTWGCVSTRKNELQPLSAEHVFLVCGALGIKAWQRGKEGNTGDTKPPFPVK